MSDGKKYILLLGDLIVDNDKNGTCAKTFMRAIYACRLLRAVHGPFKCETGSTLLETHRFALK